MVVVRSLWAIMPRQLDMAWHGFAAACSRFATTTQLTCSFRQRTRASQQYPLAAHHMDRMIWLGRQVACCVYIRDMMGHVHHQTAVRWHGGEAGTRLPSRSCTPGFYTRHRHRAADRYTASHGNVGQRPPLQCRPRLPRQTPTACRWGQCCHARVRRRPSVQGCYASRWHRAAGRGTATRWQRRGTCPPISCCLFSASAGGDGERTHRHTAALQRCHANHRHSAAGASAAAGGGDGGGAHRRTGIATPVTDTVPLVPVLPLVVATVDAPTATQLDSRVATHRVAGASAAAGGGDGERTHRHTAAL